MSNSETLGSLRADVESQVEDLFLASDTFVTIAQANKWINKGLSKIHYWLANAGEEWLDKITGSDITLIDGTQAYALPSDFHKLIGVDEIRGSDKLTVHRYMSQERNSREGSSLDLSTFWYRLTGRNLEFIPTPGAGTIRFYYFKQFAPLVGDATFVDASVPQGWEEWAVLYAAMRYRIKNQEPLTEIKQDMAELREDIRTALQPRDLDGIKRRVDVHGRFTGGGQRDSFRFRGGA